MSPIPSMNATATDAIEQAFRRYLDVYFTQQDPAGTLARLSSAISGFGTGRDETAMTFATVSQLYRRETRRARPCRPGAVGRAVSGYHPQRPSPTTLERLWNSSLQCPLTGRPSHFSAT
ncbi:hypothetical protein [Allochromatium vinosum]|uniref:hypothetical protein n=1 Tax=Allochromatium vinosum TaxID=1049 RepID=UPI00190513CE|nr:hypothetical protein [Allochromatium vinosum]